MIETVAIHSGIGSDALKHSIDPPLARLVRARPETAPLVARQFGNRQGWSHLGEQQQLVQERWLATTSDLMAVAVWGSQARAAQERTPDQVPEHMPEHMPEQPPVQNGEKG